MRKPLLKFAVILCAFGFAGALAATAYVRRYTAEAVARAEVLAADLRQLRVGVSDYKAAPIHRHKVWDGALRERLWWHSRLRGRLL